MSWLEAWLTVFGTFVAALTCVAALAAPFWLAFAVHAWRLERHLWNGGHCPFCKGAWQPKDVDDLRRIGCRCQCGRSIVVRASRFERRPRQADNG